MALTGAVYKWRLDNTFYAYITNETGGTPFIATTENNINEVDIKEKVLSWDEQTYCKQFEEMVNMVHEEYGNLQFLDCSIYLSEFSDCSDEVSKPLIPTDIALTVEATPDTIQAEFIDEGTIYSDGEFLKHFKFKLNIPTYTAGENISIENNTISALGYVYNKEKSSIAEGKATASGSFSHAEGSGSIGLGALSHAEGLDTQANGEASHAEGIGTQANGEASHAEGIGTQANGEASHAEGSGSIGLAIWSHAEGYGTQANGEASHAEGYGTQANGTNSHAEGLSTNASGATSHAEGIGTQANGEASHAEGSGSIGLAIWSHAEGYGTQANREASHAEGYGTQANGTNSHAEGEGCIAGEANSHAEGFITKANGIASHAEGYDTQANVMASHAEGLGTQANGEASHAEGLGTKTNNNGEHAEGKYNMSNSGTISSIGIGRGISDDKRKNAFEVMNNGDVYVYNVGDYDGTNATSDSAKTLQEVLEEVLEELSGDSGVTYVGGNNIEITGNTITALGYRYNNRKRSVAEGENATASGSFSHAEGKSTEAKGDYSHAEGFSTETNNIGEHAEGQYNMSNSPLKMGEPRTISSIGIGTSDERKNAFEVMNNGDVYVYNVGDYDGKNATSDSAKTLQEVLVYLGCPIGTIVMWAGETAPNGWFLCDGSRILTQDNVTTEQTIQDKTFNSGELQNLVNIISSTYGAGTVIHVFITKNGLNNDVSDVDRGYIKTVAWVGTKVNIKELTGNIEEAYTFDSIPDWYLYKENANYNIDVTTYYYLTLPNLQQRFPLGAKNDVINKEYTTLKISYNRQSDHISLTSTSTIATSTLINLSSCGTFFNGNNDGLYKVTNITIDEDPSSDTITYYTDILVKKCDEDMNTDPGATEQSIKGLFDFTDGADVIDIIVSVYHHISLDTSLGDIGGEVAHTLTVDEMPTHTHGINQLDPSTQVSTTGAVITVDDAIFIEVSGNGNQYRTTNTMKRGISSTDYNNILSSTGGYQAHNNIPPFLAINFIIKYK